MKKLANKLVLSILTVALTIVALGTTTFAWFTLTNTARINQFQFDVQSGEGIEIKLGDLTQTTYPWLSIISEGAISDYLATVTGTDFFLKPVTSPDGTTFYTFAQSDFITGGTQVGDGYSLSLVTNTAGNTFVEAGYVEFDLSFRSPQYTKIYWTGVELTSTGNTFISDVAYTGTGAAASGIYENVTIGDVLTVEAASAARISILGNGVADVPVVFENAAVAPTGALGEYNVGNAVLGTTPIYPGSVNYYNAKNIAAGPYMQLLIPGDASADPTALSTASTVTAINNTITFVVDGPAANAQLILTMVPGATGSVNDGYYIGEVTVRIWVEGWDPEAFNAILSDIISITLNFLGDELQPAE